MASSGFLNPSNPEMRDNIISPSTTLNDNQKAYANQQNASPRFPVTSRPTFNMYLSPGAEDEQQWNPPNRPREQYRNNYQTAYGHPANRSFIVQNPPSSTDQQNPITNDAQATYLQKLVEELKSANHTQADTIVLLKLRVAVLESQLERAQQDKDSANSSLSTLLGLCARVTGGLPLAPQNAPCLEDRKSRDDVEKEIRTLKDQEREIEFLRKTVKRQARELKETSDDQKRGRSRSPVRRDIRDRQSLPIPSSHPDFNRPVKEAISDFHNANGHHPLNNSPNYPPPAIPQIHISQEGSSNRVSPLPQSYGQEESFETTITIPNPTAQPDVIPTDIEFTSLDDLFYDTEDEDARQQKRLRERYFSTPPAPGIVQTGIVEPGTYLGRDSEFPRTEQLMAGRWLKDYDRHAPPPAVPRFGSDLTTISAISNAKIPKPVSFDASLWTSANEREYAIDEHFRQSVGEKRRYPDLFKFGIQFRPTGNDSNFSRSITISNIPLDIKLRDILSRVCGGMIVRSILCNTVSLTGTKTAFITFLTDMAATNYINHTKLHPLIFLSDSSTVPSTAIITRIETPTYPNTSQLPSQPTRTRCLQIHDFPRYESLSYLQKLLAGNNFHRRNTLIDIWMDEERSVFLQFSSVAASGSAYACLISWRQYRSLQVHFLPDPCAGDVSEFLEDVKPVPRLTTFSRSEGSEEEGHYARQKEFLNRRRLMDQEERGRNVTGPPRRRLAALTGQTVEILKMDGKAIAGTSWADEVNELDYGPEEAPFSSSSSGKVESGVSGCSNVEVLKEQKPPTGLEGNKYNSATPEFENRGRSLKRSGAPELQSQSTAAGLEAHIRVNVTTRGGGHAIEHNRAYVVVESDKPAAVQSENQADDEATSSSGDETVIESKDKKRKGITEESIIEVLQLSHPCIFFSPSSTSAEMTVKNTRKENPDEIDLSTDSESDSDLEGGEFKG